VAQRRYFFYSPEMNLLSESELTNAATPQILYEYIWFNGHPVAQIDAPTTTHWTFTDHLGTPLIQTDTAGAIYWRAEYEPYGKVFSLRAGDQHQPLRLPGQQAEQLNLGTNGLTERFYNVFRWYRPNWGRYTQPDPLGLGFETNPFLYGAANPVRFTDPTGLLAELCCRPTDFARQISHCFIRADGTTYSLFPEGSWLASRGVPRRDDPRDQSRKDESCSECKPKPCPDFPGTHKDCFEQVHAAYPITGYGFALSSNTYAATLAKNCCEGGFPSGFGFTPGSGFPPPRLRTRPLPIR
jgi:RHS repeat-associated protein